MQRPLESRRKMLTLETGSIFHLLMFKCLFHIEMTPTSLWCPRGPASRYTTLISVSVDLHGTSFRYEEAHPACSAGCTFDHLHPSVKSRHATVIWWRTARLEESTDLNQLTFQRCTRSLLWKSIRETWTEVWRRTPCECCPIPRACWPCSRAVEG